MHWSASFASLHPQDLLVVRFLLHLVLQDSSVWEGWAEPRWSGGVCNPLPADGLHGTSIPTAGHSSLSPLQDLLEPKHILGLVIFSFRVDEFLSKSVCGIPPASGTAGALERLQRRRTGNVHHGLWTWRGVCTARAN